MNNSKLMKHMIWVFSDYLWVVWHEDQSLKNSIYIEFWCSSLWSKSVINRVVLGIHMDSVWPLLVSTLCHSIALQVSSSRRCSSSNLSCFHVHKYYLVIVILFFLLDKTDAEENEYWTDFKTFRISLLSFLWWKNCFIKGIYEAAQRWFGLWLVRYRDQNSNYFVDTFM